jgi:hypothetical protein
MRPLARDQIPKVRIEENHRLSGNHGTHLIEEMLHRRLERQIGNQRRDEQQEWKDGEQELVADGCRGLGYGIGPCTSGKRAYRTRSRRPPGNS